MKDRFLRGFFSGMIATVITAPLALAAKHFELVTLQLSDFAGVLSLGRVPQTLAENLFASTVDLMVSGALGIIFAYLILYIGSEYLLFKGWFYSGAVWYLYYPTLVVGFKEDANMDVMTASINGLLAGLFGIALALAYHWLCPTKKRMKGMKDKED